MNETTPSFTTRITCRACNSGDLIPAFALGNHYVSDFVEQDKVLSGIQAPIELVMCGQCALVQLRHTARQDFLYSRHYWYRSGVTLSMRRALKNVANAVEDMYLLKEGDVVLDIGSNDGTLLRSYTTRGIRRVGVEPATNLAAEGAQGVDTFINDFWSFSGYWDTVKRQAKVITALGMFYDLEEPNEFIGDIAKVLAPDGLFIAQLMTLRNMLDTNDLGNLCHEHLEFYSMKSLGYLLEKHGLQIVDMEVNDVNGQSDRYYIKHIASHSAVSSRVHHTAKAEEQITPIHLTQFYASMLRNRDSVRSLVGQVRDAGGSVWVYGASTKGNTLLQFYGLDHTLIDGAAERSPEKWGKYTIGTGIPIYSEEEARKKATHFLILPYAFLNEFIAREADWRDAGGRFIVPLPYARIV